MILFIRAFYFAQNHFWSSEEIFFIGKKCKIFILTVSFFAKNILEFGRKKFEFTKVTDIICEIESHKRWVRVPRYIDNLKINTR
jgi:hypothetical protein